MTLSFGADIRPLFRDAPDIEAMKRYGLDLSSYEQVKEKAQDLCDPGRWQHALRRTLAEGKRGALQTLDG